jgi:CopA family copper-resistance protein
VDSRILSRPPGLLAPMGLSRRQFVEGLALGTLAGALPAVGAWPQASTDGPSGASGGAVLSGTQMRLEIAPLEVRFTGERRIATAVNGQLPGPLLRWREGDTVTVQVTNRLRVPTSLHWHGVLVPAGMDGVPGLSFAGIAPGETFSYRFAVRQAGTYWYHSHSRFQQQTGLHGPIVIEPRDAAPDRGRRFARDHTLLLSDWSDLDPERIYRLLKVDSDHFQYGRRTAAGLVRESRQTGLGAALADRFMWGGMRMMPTDLADVTGHAYTYLLNGATPAANWTGLFAPGERVRLRFINGSSMSFFDVRIPGLKLTVIAADGQDVEPVTIEEFRLGAGEVLDVAIEPEDRAYTVFAQSIDRSGFARGTLAPRPGMQAEIPTLDPHPLLTMVDMGAGSMKGMEKDMPGMDMKHMPDMNMKDMQPHAPGPAPDFGPLVDGRSRAPQSRLDDPGVGLRANGRRVLTYADLHNTVRPLDRREPTREVVLHLTGHMQRYVWSFDGRKFSEAPPLSCREGERLRIVLVNDTMMAHPIHLHGMWSEVLAESGAFQVRKHTVTVQPGQWLAYAVSADAPGRWAFHCHLLYHMEAGMFRELDVRPAELRR